MDTIDKHIDLLAKAVSHGEINLKLRVFRGKVVKMYAKNTSRYTCTNEVELMKKIAEVLSSLKSEHETVFKVTRERDTMNIEMESNLITKYTNGK